MCMVCALLPEYDEKTLAARPVGASSVVFLSNCCIVRTRAEMSEVFPVPAYPQRRNTLRSSSEKRKSARLSIAFSCSAVGVNGKFDFICEAKYLFITFYMFLILVRKTACAGSQWSVFSSMFTLCILFLCSYVAPRL